MLSTPRGHAKPVGPKTLVAVTLFAALLAMATAGPLLAAVKYSPAEKTLLSAVEAYVQGSYPRALDLAGKAIALDPALAAAYNLRGAALNELNRPREAMTDLERAVQLQPDLPEAHVNLSYAHQLAGEPDLALRHADKAVNLAGGNPVAFTNRAQVKAGLGDHAGAIADCEQALKLEPQHAAAYRLRADSLLAGRQAQAALQDYARALKLHPNQPEALLGQARAQLALGRASEAQATLRRAAAVAPPQPAYQAALKQAQAQSLAASGGQAAPHSDPGRGSAGFSRLERDSGPTLSTGPAKQPAPAQTAPARSGTSFSTGQAASSRPPDPTAAAATAPGLRPKPPAPPGEGAGAAVVVTPEVKPARPAPLIEGAGAVVTASPESKPKPPSPPGEGAGGAVTATSSIKPKPPAPPGESVGAAVAVAPVVKPEPPAPPGQGAGATAAGQGAAQVSATADQPAPPARPEAPLEVAAIFTPPPNVASLEPPEQLKAGKQVTDQMDDPCGGLQLKDDEDGELAALAAETDPDKLDAKLEAEEREEDAPPPRPGLEGLQSALAQSLDNLTRRQYAGAVNAAKEALLRVLGPLPAAQQRRFDELWTPLLDHPSRKVLRYLEKLNPLLVEYLELEQAIDTALAAQDEARYELEMALAHESADGAREQLAGLGQLRAQLVAQKGRLAAVESRVKALGDPPNPMEDKCRARRKARKAWGLDEKGGGAWVLTSQRGEVRWRMNDQRIAKNDLRFEGATAKVYSTVPANLISAKGDWPEFVISWLFKWTAPPKLIADGDALRLLVGIQDTGTVYADGRCWSKIYLRSPHHLLDHVVFDGMVRNFKPEYLVNGRYVSLVTETLRVGGYKKRTPQEIAKGETAVNWIPQEVSGKHHWKNLNKAQDGWTMTIEVVVNSAYISGAAIYEYKFDAKAAAPPPMPDPSATAVAAAPPPKQEPDDESKQRASLKEKVDFHQANAKLLEEDLRRLQEMLAKARDDASRAQIQYQIIAKDADLAREHDAIATLQTGEFTRTRTGWDVMVSYQMAERSAEAAARIAEGNHRRGALERLTSLLPPEERDRMRRWAAQHLGPGEPDPEKLNQVARTIHDKAQALNLLEAASQEEKAAEAGLGVEILENYQTAARYTMYATPFVAGGPALAMAYGLASGSVVGYQTGGILGENYKGPTGAAVGAVMTAARYLSAEIDYGLTFVEGALAVDEKGQQGGLVGGLTAVVTTFVERKATQAVTTRIQAVQARYQQVRRQAKLDAWRDAKRKADFQQERQYGKAMVEEHQRAYQQFQALKRSGQATPQQIQAAEARLMDMTAAIKQAPHAKGYLKFNASPEQRKAYASTDRLHTARVVKEFKQDLARQGVQVDDLTFKPIRNAGNTSPGMDLDLAASSKHGARVPVFDPKTNKPMVDAKGQPVTRLVEKLRIKDPKTGQIREMDMLEGNKFLQARFNQVYAGQSGGRSAKASWQVVTSGKHLEAYSDLAWLRAGKMGRRGGATLAEINSGQAAQAALVTQVKADEMAHQTGAGKDNIAWEQGRGTAKDIRTKVLPLLRAKFKEGGNSPAAKQAMIQKYRFYRKLARAMEKSNHDPVAAQHAVKELTGYDLPDTIKMTTIGIEALGKWK